MHLAQLVVSQIRDKVVITDLEGRITFLNDAECEMLGRSRGELLGRHVRVFGADEASRAMQDRIVREARERGHWRGEVTNYRSDGTPVVLDSRVRLLRDESGEPVALCGISTDVTQQRLIQRRMRRSERMKNLILNSTTEMVAYYDTDLRIQWANRASGQSVESSPGELVGKHCYEVWHGSDTPCEDCPVLLARDTGEARSTEQQTPDGRIWSVRGYPVFDDGGDVIGMVEFGNDITRQRKAERDRARLEQQFQRAQRLESVGRLGGGVAHDLNNLLSPILGYSEMLLESTPDADPRAEQLEQILGAARRARDLVGQLLAFSRRQTMEFGSVDLSGMVGDFFELIRRTLRENISIELDLEEELPPVRGDRGQLEQVLLNLAVNAQDAMPDGGELRIGTSLAELDEAYAAVHDNVEPGSYVMLSMADTGCGMDQDTREHIFEPFFTTKRQGKGTGLGLSTAYGIVKQHDGHIWVYSEPGRGTTFRIYVPVSECAALSATDDRESRPQAEGGSETVLLAEDDPQVRRLAREMLQQKGYSVICAQSGSEALSLLEDAGRVDLLLTDIIMQDMDGRNLYCRVREVRPNVRVLYMSGYTEDVLSEGGPEHQGAGFLQKPFSLATLAAKVRQVLDS
jgi:PAS domain S-box-containing protein